MARKSQSRPKPADKAAAASTAGPFELFYPVLANCSLDRTPKPEGSEDADAERFYDAVIHPMDFSKAGDDIAVCEFSAGQKVKDVRVLEISATYFVGFRLADSGTDAIKTALVEQVVSAAAWPMFRDLFIHIGSQSGEELPLLPNVPMLRWQAAADAGDTAAD